MGLLLLQRGLHTDVLNRMIERTPGSNGPGVYFSAMLRNTVLLLLCLSRLLVQAQDKDRYDDLIREAYALYDQKQYAESGKRYSDAFEALGWKGYAADRYNAACSWALAKVPDSAFFNLQRLAEKMGFDDARRLESDPDLDALRLDTRWAGLLDLVRANRAKAEAHLDRPLAALLDSIHDEDQTLRQHLSDVEAAHGSDSPEMQRHWKLIHEKDSTNLIVVERILKERGWLGPEVVGNKGSSTLFLVIQHADLNTQEKYLPMLREAVRKGNARGSELALLEDRVLMRRGKHQIYGSQIAFDEATGEKYLSPVEDPDRLDERRASVGLEPIADYLDRFGLTWDLEAYKARLPELERMQRETFR